MDKKNIGSSFESWRREQGDHCYITLSGFLPVWVNTQGFALHGCTLIG